MGQSGLSPISSVRREAQLISSRNSSFKLLGACGTCTSGAANKGWKMRKKKKKNPSHRLMLKKPAAPVSILGLEHNKKTAPLSILRLHSDFSAMLLHNSLTNRQAQTGP